LLFALCPAGAAALEIMTAFASFGITDPDESLRRRLAALHTTATAATTTGSTTGTAFSFSRSEESVSIDRLSAPILREFEQALLVLLQLIGKQKYPHAAVTVMYANAGRVTINSKVVIRHANYQRRYVNFSVLGTGMLYVL